MAKTKKESHTGFRNGALFCFNCGQHYDMPKMPQPVSMFITLCKQFDKDHKHCEKTWMPPTVDQSLSEIDKAMWWKTGMNGERGISSECMWEVIMYQKKFPKNAGHPNDPDDFRRCYLLLQTVPEWKEKLHLMKEVSPVWSNLVDNWQTLTDMLEKAMANKTGSPEMYELMKKIGC